MKTRNPLNPRPFYLSASIEGRGRNLTGGPALPATDMAIDLYAFDGLENHRVCEIVCTTAKTLRDLRLDFYDDGGIFHTIVIPKKLASSPPPVLP